MISFDLLCGWRLGHRCISLYRISLIMFFFRVNLECCFTWWLKPTDITFNLVFFNNFPFNLFNMFLLQMFVQTFFRPTTICTYFTNYYIFNLYFFFMLSTSVNYPTMVCIKSSITIVAQEFNNFFFFCFNWLGCKCFIYWVFSNGQIVMGSSEEKVHVGYFASINVDGVG